MRILFLGTGAATGVPSLCCDCEVCRSGDPKNKRLRASALVQNGGHNVLIDTSTDLRQQCLTHDIKNIHGILYTHPHADHIHGIDELRNFTHFNKTTIPCYGNEMTLDAIKRNFSYIFNGKKPEGGVIPQLTLHPVATEIFSLGGMTITPLEVFHGSSSILGYKIDNAVYITDCSKIPPATIDKIRGIDLLVLNSLRYTPHPTHFCMDEALNAAREICPKRTILTHIGHQYDHAKVNRELPENVELAYDGMSVEV